MKLYKAFAITLRINIINYKDLINFVTLRTLKALNILTDLNAEIAEVPPLPKKNNSNKERTTIIASNKFILSRK